MARGRDIYGDKGRKPDITPDKKQAEANRKETARRLREQGKGKK